MEIDGSIKGVIKEEMEDPHVEVLDIDNDHFPKSRFSRKPISEWEVPFRYFNGSKSSWDVLVIILVIYTIITVPLELGFQSSSVFSPPQGYFFEFQYLSSIDLLVDVLFFIDICLVFATSIPDRKMNEIRNFESIAWKYLTGYFVFDFISCIPFDILASLTGSYQQFATSSYFLKCLKIPRLLRLSRIFVRLENMSVAAFWRIFRLCFTVAIVVHITACIYAGILETQDSVWLHSYPPIFTQQWHYRYIICVHAVYTIILGNSANPTNIFENVFEIFALSVGIFLQATIIGQISMIINNGNASALEFREVMDKCNESMRLMEITDKEIIYKVQSFLERSFTVYGSCSGPKDDWIKYLSPDLQKTILEIKYKGIVHGAPLFKHASVAFLRQILHKIQTLLTLPGEVIIREGDRGREMFFIVDGECVAQRVMLKNSKRSINKQVIMKAGDFFGEIALLDSDCRRTLDVISVDYSDLGVLTKEGLEDAFRDFPEYERFFKQISILRNEHKGKLSLDAIIELAQERADTLEYSQREKEREEARNNAKEVMLRSKKNNSIMNLHKSTDNYNNSSYVNNPLGKAVNTVKAVDKMKKMNAPPSTPSPSSIHFSSKSVPEKNNLSSLNNNINNNNKTVQEKNSLPYISSSSKSGEDKEPIGSKQIQSSSPSQSSYSSVPSSTPTPTSSTSTSSLPRSNIEEKELIGDSLMFRKPKSPSSSLKRNTSDPHK